MKFYFAAALAAASILFVFPSISFEPVAEPLSAEFSEEAIKYAEEHNLMIGHGDCRIGNRRDYVVMSASGEVFKWNKKCWLS